MIFTRKYGTTTSGGTNILIPIVKRAAVDFAVSADWTPASGDVKVSKDGGAAANIGTLPTALTMGNGAVWVFTLADTELQCKQLTVTVVDAATKAIEDQAFVVETFGHASAMYPSDVGANNLDAEGRLISGARAIVTGVVGSGSDSLSVVCSSLSLFGGVTSVGANALAGARLFFAGDTTTAALRAVRGRITANTSGSTPTLTIATADELPASPASGDVFSIH